MAEAGHNDGREVVPRLSHGIVDAFDVIEREVHQMRPVLRCHTGQRWRAPRDGPVIGAFCNQDLATSGTGPRDRHASRHRV